MDYKPSKAGQNACSDAMDMAMGTNMHMKGNSDSSVSELDQDYSATEATISKMKVANMKRKGPPKMSQVIC